MPHLGFYSECRATHPSPARPSLVPTISIRYVPPLFSTNPSRSSRLVTPAAHTEVPHTLRRSVPASIDSNSGPSVPSSVLNEDALTISTDSYSGTVSEAESEAYEGDGRFDAESSGSSDEECEEEEANESDSSDTLRGFPTPNAEIARDLAAYRASLRSTPSSPPSSLSRGSSLARGSSDDWPVAMRGWTAALELAAEAMRHRITEASTPSEHSDSDEDSDSDSTEDVEDDDDDRKSGDSRRRVLVERVLAARAGERAAERAELAAWKRAHPQAPTYADFFHQDRDTRDAWEAWELAYRGGWRISEATRERARRNAEIRSFQLPQEESSEPEDEGEGRGWGVLGAVRGDTSRHPVYVGQASSVSRGHRSAAAAETLYGLSVGRADALAQVQATRRAAIEAANKRFWAERELGLYLLRQSHLQVDGGCQALESGALLI